MCRSSEETKGGLLPKEKCFLLLWEDAGLRGGAGPAQITGRKVIPSLIRRDTVNGGSIASRYDLVFA